MEKTSRSKTVKNGDLLKQFSLTISLSERKRFKSTNPPTKLVKFDQEEFTCTFTSKVTITYSSNPPPTNNALVYTNAKPKHPYLSSSSSYDSIGNSGSKIISSDPLNLANEQEKRNKPHQECQSENYKSTSPSGDSSEAITVANQMNRTTLLLSFNTG